MLTQVKIENFKAIEQLTMEFSSQLTVIVGPNGSGKTSVLQAIDSCNKSSIPDTYGRRGSFARSKVAIVTSYGQKWEKFSERDATNASRRLISLDEDVEDGIPLPPPFASVLFRFASSAMGLPSSDEGNPPPLNLDGSNLASVLSSLCLNQPDKFDAIKSCLREIVPGIRQIRFQRVKLTARDNLRKTEIGSLIGDQILFDTSQASDIPADSMSEGTLLALGIVTAMVLGNGQIAILIDDLDASLHPSAQAELVRVIRRLEEGRPDLQVIATSHSPYLLDSLNHDEIRLMSLNDVGGVVCGTLMDHPNFERWKNEMTPGEMWGMWGESWLTKSQTEMVQP